MSEHDSLLPVAPHAPGSVPVGGVPYPADRGAHLLDRLALLYKYRHIALTIFVISFIAVMLNTYSTVPVYQAHARLLIQDERAAAKNLEETYYYYEDPEPYFQTQYEILKGRQLADKVISVLALTNAAALDGAARPPTGIGAAVRQIRHAVHADVNALVNVAHHRPAPAAAPAEDRAGLIDAFLSRVSVVPIPRSHLVDVYFSSADPKRAAHIADALAEQYVQQNLDFRLQTTDKTLQWLETELAKQQARVEADDRAMANYREQQDALSLEDRQNIVVSRLNQLNDAVTKARTVLIQKQAVYEQVQQALQAGNPQAIPQVLQDSYVQNLMTQLADLQRQKTQLSERYGDKYPAMIKVNASIADARRQLDAATTKAVEAIHNDYQSALSEEQRLQAILDQQKGQAATLNRKGIDYSALQRNADSDRQVLQTLLSREKEMRVAANSGANNVRLLDHAETPDSPVSPDPRRAAGVGLLLGLALGVGAAFGLDYLNDTIKTPEDITGRLALPFLGLVPAVGRRRGAPLLTASPPHEFGEAFRALRTSLVLPAAGFGGPSGCRTLLITSAQPLEGKTTTACNLALALALGGARVLVIDADLRRPGLHRMLQLSNARGLADVLAGGSAIRDAIQSTAEPNLVAMTAGAPPSNPSELLASDRMQQLLASLAHGPFDWVLLDAPPVLAVTDAVILAPLVSGVAFVFGSEMTRRRTASRAVQTILAADPRAMGGILNRVDLGRNRYYYSRYGYTYSSYYTEAAAI